MFRLLKAVCFLGSCLCLSTISCLAFIIDVAVVEPGSGMMHSGPVDLDDRKELDFLPAYYLADLVDFGMPAAKQSSVKIQGFSFASTDELGVSQDQEGLRKITKVLYQVQKAGRIISDFTGQELLSVPFGIEGTHGSFYYTMLFDNLRLHSEHASFDVIVGLYHPILRDTLVFIGDSIRYNNRQGFVGTANLRLYHDFTLEVKSGKVGLVLRAPRPGGSEGTYLQVDCNGIQKLGLGVSLYFNPDLLEPVDSELPMVEAFSQFDFDPGSGLVLEDMSVSPFRLPGLDQVAFAMDGLTLDLDEQNDNHPAINDYLDRVARLTDAPIDTKSVNWTGLYCDYYSILVSSLNLNGSGEPLRFEGRSLVVDDLGVSTSFSVYNADILPKSNGSLAGWPISVSDFQIDVLTNQIRVFGFGGALEIPIFSSDAAEHTSMPDSSVRDTSDLRYFALYDIDSSAFDFTVSNVGEKSIPVPMLLAELDIYEGSYLNIRTGNDLKIETFLNGRITFNGRAGNSDFTSPAVEFSGLMVSNRPPYFAVRALGPLGDRPANFGIFKLSLNKLRVSDHQPEIYDGQAKEFVLEDLSIDLGDIDDGDAMSITTSIRIVFAVEPDDRGRQKWSGRRFMMDEVAFEGRLPGAEYVKGGLRFFMNDPVYGDGFAGTGEVKLTAVPASVGMTCLFGNTGKEGFRFSYVDALVSYDQPATEAGASKSAFQVYVLAGGYFKNMSRKPLEHFYADKEMDLENTRLGGALPGNAFVPSKGAWGVKAGIIAKFGSAATAGLRLAYESYPSEDQGLYSRFFLEGMVEILPGEDPKSSQATQRLTGEDEVEEGSQHHECRDFAGSGKFGGYIRIEIVRDQTGNTFDAALGMHGTVGALGINFYGNYYRDPDSWHLFIGRPEPGNRLSIAYGQKEEGLSTYLQLNAYLMVGNSRAMPGSTPRPYAANQKNQALLDSAYLLLQADPTNQPLFQSSAVTLANGRAFAFGAGFGAGLDADLGFMYVSGGLDVGFDVLLLPQYPSCNLTNISETGMNGWYMQGQFYAGLSARVGLQVGKVRLDVLNAGVSVLLRGAGFNPTYGVGSWFFKYKLLWIEGSAEGICRFGTPCQTIVSSLPASDPLENIFPDKPVASTGTSEYPVVSMNSDVHAQLAIPADQTIVEKVTDFDTGTSTSYRLKVRYEVSLSDSNGAIAHHVSFKDNGHTLVIRPEQMLSPGEVVQCSLNVRVVDTQGRDFFLGDQTFISDTTVQYLVDPKGLKGLDTGDLAASYPIPNQAYFHIREFPSVAVDFGKPLPANDLSFYSQFFQVDGDGERLLTTTSAEVVQGRIQSKIPGELNPSRHYRWDIVAEDGISSWVFTSLYFRTSAHNTFAQKTRSFVFKSVPIDSLSKDDSVFMVRLDTSQCEPLEVWDGNHLTAIIAESKTTAKDLGNSFLKPLNQRSEEVSRGEQYLSRFYSMFNAIPRYVYYHTIQRYIPYGKRTIYECLLDDMNPQSRTLADPNDRFREVDFRAFAPQLLSTSDQGVQFDLLSQLGLDQREFLSLTPEPSLYYAFCKCDEVETGPLPGYQSGTYLLQARYFIPCFDTFSSSNVNLVFDVE